MLSLPHRSLLLAACLVLLPSCSGGEDRGAEATGESAQEFSQANKSAARALSLSNAGATRQAGSPQEQAALCSQALEALSLRLRDSGTLSDTQLQALGEAKGIYDRRLEGGTPQTAPGGSSGDRPNEQEANPAEQARIAIGCLQDLQTAG